MKRIKTILLSLLVIMILASCGTSRDISQKPAAAEENMPAESGPETEEPKSESHTDAESGQEGGIIGPMPEYQDIVDASYDFDGFAVTARYLGESALFHIPSYVTADEVDAAAKAAVGAYPGFFGGVVYWYSDGVLVLNRPDGWDRDAIGELEAILYRELPAYISRAVGTEPSATEDGNGSSETSETSETVQTWERVEEMPSEDDELDILAEYAKYLQSIGLDPDVQIIEFETDEIPEPEDVWEEVQEYVPEYVPEAEEYLPEAEEHVPVQEPGVETSTISQSVSERASSATDRIRSTASKLTKDKSGQEDGENVVAETGETEKAEAGETEKTEADIVAIVLWCVTAVLAMVVVIRLFAGRKKRGA